MADEALVKKCPSCGKRLRSDNKRGACSACLASAGGSALLRGEAPKERVRVQETEAVAPEEHEPGAQRALFDALCMALGIDGEPLIAQAVEEFCEDWIADVKAKVSPTAAVPRRSLPADED